MSEIRVFCAGCDRDLWISRDGETECVCGVRHTFVTGEVQT